MENKIENTTYSNSISENGEYNAWQMAKALTVLSKEELSELFGTTTTNETLLRFQAKEVFEILKKNNKYAP